MSPIKFWGALEVIPQSAISFAISSKKPSSLLPLEYPEDPEEPESRMSKESDCSGRERGKKSKDLFKHI